MSWTIPAIAAFLVANLEVAIYWVMNGLVLADAGDAAKKAAT